MTATRFSAQAEFWLSLSQAFLPPMNRGVAGAFIAYLPQDLGELLGAMGVDAGEDIDALRASLRSLPNAEALLTRYSTLFLPPSQRAPLNVSVHLDGSLNGAAMDGIEALMARYGVARSEGFRDLPDHLASLLEFLAMLAEQRGTDDDRAMLAGAYLLPALAKIEALIGAHAADSPYLHLVRIVRRALAPFARPEQPDKRRERAEKRADTDLGVWQACRSCGKPYAREKEIRIMAKALQECGLPTGHLHSCPDCRTAAQEWIKRPLPAV